MGSFFNRWYRRAINFYQYCTVGVWREPRNTMFVRIVKTANLSVRSFLDRGLQMKSAALTYSSALAIVPAIALLLAIGRGFGFQDIISSSLYEYFPAQHQALETAMGFVDSYLKEAANGIFVGIGVVVLLYTLVSLLSTVEEAFNNVWDIKKDRTLYQKVTDYIAICLLVPILMVCSSGVSIFMSTLVQNNLALRIFTPLINVALEAAPLVLAWLAFTLSYFLIPNTKVQFKYAAIAGAICAVAFQILQLLFVNGQIYVSKYNAIYGSFAFLPLLLVWMQLSWLILLFGCVLTYAMQNIFAFNFLGDVTTVSADYRRKVLLVVTAAIFQRFEQHLAPLTRHDLSTMYDIPIRMVGDLTFSLHKAGLIYYVVLPDEEQGFAPATDAGTLSVGDLFRRIDALGDTDFIPRFNKIYEALVERVDQLNQEAWERADDIRVIDVPLPTPDEIATTLSAYKISVIGPHQEVKKNLQEDKKSSLDTIMDDQKEKK
ncbi:MAG: YihY/virulence factor BrkB family protein [Muribaculaceae bacterium]|nr:YihY/virulence factor BrkB family protein [Muribaculaceae bacterium]